MDIEIITSKAEIARGQQSLVQSISQYATDRRRMELGFQGGANPATVFYCPELGMWAAFERAVGRYWNAFGIGNPFDAPPSITVEVNPPLEGLNRKVQGAVGRHLHGGYLLLHRGGVGGGKKGVGKSRFLEFYTEVGALRQVKDGDRATEVIIVGWLGDDSSAAQIASFVRQVAVFKGTAAESLPPSSAVDPGEFEGIKRLPPRPEMAVLYRHGPVVNELNNQLRRRGFVTARDVHRDIVIQSKGGRIRTVIEVKPSADRYSIYTALGQLLIHGRGNVGRVAVLPEAAEKHLGSHLDQYGIQLLLFRWDGPKPVFLNLDQVKF